MFGLNESLRASDPSDAPADDNAASNSQKRVWQKRGARHARCS